MQDSVDAAERSTPTDDALTAALDVLEQLAEDRGLLSRLDEEARQRLMKAAERVASPDRESRKRLVRAFKKREQAELSRKKAEDELRLARTGIRNQLGTRQRKKPCPPAPFEVELPPPSTRSDETYFERLSVARSCYMCKREFHKVHFF